MFTRCEMTAEMSIQIHEWRTGWRSEISLQGKGCGISPLKDGMRKKQMGREMAPSYVGTKDESDFLVWVAIIERRLSHGQVKIFTDLNSNLLLFHFVCVCVCLGVCV